MRDNLVGQAVCYLSKLSRLTVTTWKEKGRTVYTFWYNNRDIVDFYSYQRAKEFAKAIKKALLNGTAKDYFDLNS